MLSLWISSLSLHKKGLVVYCFVWEFYLHLTDLLGKDIDSFFPFFSFLLTFHFKVCVCMLSLWNLQKFVKNNSKHLTNLNETDQRMLPQCFFPPEALIKMVDIRSSLAALPHVKRIERRVRRNNCLICPFACRCPNHSRLIQKMQAWMSEGLLWRGGAFQWLWTAVPG